MQLSNAEQEVKGQEEAPEVKAESSTVVSDIIAGELSPRTMDHLQLSSCTLSNLTVYTESC